MVLNKPQRARKDGTRAEVARRLGVSTTAVTKMERTGKLDEAKRDDGSLDPDRAVIAWQSNVHPADRKNKRTKISRNADEQTLREAAEEIGVDPDNLLTYNEASTLLRNCQARIAEIELAEKSGRMIDQEEVAKEWFRGCRVARDSIFAVPSRLSAELAGITDPFVIEARMTEELRVAVADIIAGLQ